MKTAEEILMHNLAGYENILGNLKSSIVEGMKEYAKEAIKEDRKHLTYYARAKENPADYGTGEIWVDGDSIINAPNIVLP